MKLYEGFYWPRLDEGCHAPTVTSARELKDKWLPHVRGRAVAVQAGGNCGVYPLELSRHFSQVYTFEPDSHNFECLLINCRGVENIQARCAALADKECTVALQLNPNNCGSHHVSGSGTIPALTIDSLKLDACDLIALDVEGYEWPALQGAYRTLDLFHPTLILETKKHGERYGYKSDQMRDWVKERGYTYRDKVGRDEIWS